MLSYIKIIKLYLFIIISIFFSNISFAHEIKPSIADFTYDENYLNIEVRLNAELILSNIDASNISNTNSSPLTEIYDRYRLLNKKDLEEKKRFQEIASKINKKMIIFKKEAKENGDLYASIKPKEISNYIQSNFKIDIKPSEIVLKQDLKIIGNFEIDINLHFEVTAKVKIQIKKLDDLR